MCSVKRIFSSFQRDPFACTLYNVYALEHVINLLSWFFFSSKGSSQLKWLRFKFSARYLIWFKANRGKKRLELRIENLKKHFNAKLLTFIFINLKTFHIINLKIKCKLTKLNDFVAMIRDFSTLSKECGKNKLLFIHFELAYSQYYYWQLHEY